MKTPDYDDNYDPYGTDDPDVGKVNYGEMPPARGADPRAARPAGAAHKSAPTGKSPVRGGTPSPRSTAVQGANGAAYRSTDPRYGTSYQNGAAANGTPRHDAPVARNGYPSRDARSASASGAVYDNAVPVTRADKRAYDNAADQYADGTSRELSPDEVSRKALGRTRRSPIRFNPGVAVTVGVFAVIIAVCVIFALTRRDKPEDTESTDVFSGEVTENAGALTSPVEAGFERISVPTASVHEGDLILVNYDHPYVFPEKDDLASVYNYKSKTYKVSDTTTQMSKAVIDKFNVLMDDFYENTNCGDVLVVSGYRDYETQQRIYQDRVETQGAEMAANYVADPGKSEHHTGMAMDLSVYLYDGSSFYLEEYPLCRWFVDHAPEYGFVLRYPEEKAEITKISYESWHYRYVGATHAKLMVDRDLCLEEYVDFLREYEYGKKYLVCNPSGVSASDVFVSGADAVIYFVPAGDGEQTTVCVPVGCRYEISGNNADGFIVTAYPKDKE